MSFPPFILPRLTVVWPRWRSPCNIVLYLHSKNTYLHSISRTSRNKYMYILPFSTPVAFLFLQPMISHLDDNSWIAKHIRYVHKPFLSVCSLYCYQRVWKHSASTERITAACRAFSRSWRSLRSCWSIKSRHLIRFVRVIGTFLNTRWKTHTKCITLKWKNERNDSNWLDHQLQPTVSVLLPFSQPSSFAAGSGH